MTKPTEDFLAAIRAAKANGHKNVADFLTAAQKDSTPIDTTLEEQLRFSASRGDMKTVSELADRAAITLIATGAKPTTKMLETAVRFNPRQIKP
jgi:hypothetical protein